MAKFAKSRYSGAIVNTEKNTTMSRLQFAIQLSERYIIAQDAVMSLGYTMRPEHLVNVRNDDSIIYYAIVDEFKGEAC
jgi:Tfp pilus assembly protein PilE